MNSEFVIFCRKMAHLNGNLCFQLNGLLSLQGSYPQNILDLASDQSRYSLCDQLQVLANRASEASTDGENKVKMGGGLGG